jgi:cell division protease FtsH
MSREELRDRLCVLLGGRSAEELSCGDVSTGAEDDLERATEPARAMICRFGMSEALGAVSWRRSEPMRWFAGTGDQTIDASEETARAIDAEVRALVEAEHARARGLLAERAETLELVARELLERETVEGDRLRELVRTPTARDPAPACANGATRNVAA